MSVTMDGRMATIASPIPHLQMNKHNHPHHLSETQRYRNNFMAGGIALATAFAVMHPLDTMKTRMQASAGSAGSVIGLRGLLTVQTARVLGKGFLASVLGAGPQGGLRLATYEFTKTHMLSTSPNRPSYLPTFGPIAASALSAITGDFVSSIIKVPREVVTARLQTGHYEAQGGRSGASFAIRTILREEGVAGLFRGFWSTTARDWPFMVILFTTYESFKQFHHQFSFSTDDSSSSSSSSVLAPVRRRVGTAIAEEMHDEIPITTFKSTIFGGISGALAGYLTTPFDVIKTKIMTSGPGRVTMWSVAKEIVNQRRRTLEANGRVRMVGSVGLVKPLGAFFTGAVARSTWWFCVCSMFFPAYEGMKGVFKDLSG